MRNDGILDVAVGMSAGSRSWKNKKYQWSELVKKLKKENKTNETYKEFMSVSKEDQGKIKDVGGYVGGYLRNGRRRPENVVYRQLLALDLDFATLAFWEEFTMLYGNAAVLHGTHKHSEQSPRYRLIMPLSREVTPDEYTAISRRIAGDLGIELFDDTTFQTSRLMFWPSCPIDVDYYCEVQDGSWVDADNVLASYSDWSDSSLWPTSSTVKEKIEGAASKQEDPEQKRGIIGVFCRTYSIEEAIKVFLPEVYTPSTEGRYSYAKGTAASGLVVYGDSFAYSHHGTDPAGGKLCNSFDLVRLHMFGHLDTNPELTASKLKSFKAMEDFCRQDKKTKRTLADETLTNVKYDFSEEPLPIEEADMSWAEELEVDARGKYVSSAVNINMVFANDVNVKTAFKQNNFDNKRYVSKTLPWRKVKGEEPVKNVDEAGLRNYIESAYGIVGKLKIEDSLALEFERHSFHPVTDYLKGLKWDSVERVDTLLIDAFGAEDNLYSREAIRKCLVGAVARVFNPGVKFDLVLTLVGKQGTGKSTIFKRLGKAWFSDTFGTVTGKESFEQLQGAWLVEIAELAGLRKAEVETIKHFISKQEDMFRPAYGKVIETFKRQCIFVGTTNNKDFLRDPSGNRRFLPVDVHDVKLVDNPFLRDMEEEYIGQLWAEAVALYKAGETIYLSKEAEEVAEIEQREHSEIDNRKGIVEEYLNALLPEDWDKKSIFERRTHLNDELSPEIEGGYHRQHVCVAEIWCECLGRDKQDMDRYKTRDINDILKYLDDWKQSKSTKNFGIYGKQKYYSRKN